VIDVAHDVTTGRGAAQRRQRRRDQFSQTLLPRPSLQTARNDTS
jgi:hypothetical protein